MTTTPPEPLSELEQLRRENEALKALLLETKALIMVGVTPMDAQTAYEYSQFNLEVTEDYIRSIAPELTALKHYQTVWEYVKSLDAETDMLEALKVPIDREPPWEAWAELSVAMDALRDMEKVATP